MLTDPKPLVLLVEDDPAKSHLSGRRFPASGCSASASYPPHGHVLPVAA